MRKWIFVLSFCITLLSVFETVAEPVCNCGSTENGGDGTNCCWEYDEITKTLTVSGNGAMKDFGPDAAVGMDKLIYQAERPWNDIALDVEHVVVEGLSSVGNRAFQNMKNVEEVVLSETVERAGRSWHDSIPTVYTGRNDLSCLMDGIYSLCTVWPTTNYYPTYEKAPNGQYILNGKFYKTLTDMALKSSSVKRIYTIEEANAAAGERNTVRIKYR